MKVGDRIKYSIKWRRVVCEKIRSGQWRRGMADNINAYGRIINDLGNDLWRIRMDGKNHDELFNVSFLTKVEQP